MKSPTSCEAIVQEEKLKITLGDRVVAADPCYDEGVWCAEFDIEMKPGTYDVRTVRGEVKGTYTNDEGEEKSYNWGTRTARLSVLLTDETVETWEPVSALGVDSGRMSIWDARNYADAKDDREWVVGRYKTTHTGTGTKQVSKVSGPTPGLGDGSYFCYRGLNAKGEPVSLSIVFLYAEGVYDEDGRLNIMDESAIPYIDGPALPWENNLF